jgi:hypothetical protein
VSALSDIRAAIMCAKDRADAMPCGPFKFLATPRFKVRIGHACQQALRAEGVDRPVMIDGCAVEHTQEFPGWEIVRL